MTATGGNLFSEIERDLPDEFVEQLFATDKTRIERIVSRGQASPPGFWYDQDETEFVMVVEGEALLDIEGADEPTRLRAGDWTVLQAHQRHRVAWTAPGRVTVWLAVFSRA